jgi:hypothetical protein
MIFKSADILYLHSVINGDNEWFYINGKRHREDGPAMIYANGTRHWYKNDRFIKSKYK